MTTNWHTLTELAKNKFKDVPSDPGIYVVRWSKEGKAVLIGRLTNDDKKGILYIGSAENLRNRIRRLCRGIRQQSASHTLYKTILFCKVFETIPQSEYEISWEKVGTHDEARGQEWAAIKAYAERYKEPPPLNLGLQRECFAIIGVARIGKSRIAYKSDDFVNSTVV
jgi:uncharacterized protein with PIN domain